MDVKLKCQCHTDLQRFSLQTESFGAQLHDAVGAEGVSHPQLADGQQPQRRVGLQLHRGDQDGLVARINTADDREELSSGFVSDSADIFMS